MTLGALVILACGVSPVAMRSGRSPERTQIAFAELEPVSRRVTNPYDIVRTFRPWMLIVRDRSRLLAGGPSTPNDSRGIRVYVDDMSVGGTEVVRTIPRDGVAFIQWLSATDATTRYGGGHTGGVITVTTGARR